MSPQAQQSNSDEKLSAIIGLVLGLLFIAVGFWVRHIEAQERALLTETQGTVVDRVSRREHDTTTNEERITYAPVIEFLTNGDRTRFTGKYDSSRFSNGTNVVVRYHPQQPATTARVVDPLEGLTAWGMFGMGGLSVVFSLGTLLPLRSWLSRQQP
jgi:Protein of unknown function (DUF3592)